VSLLTCPEHPSSPPVFSGACVTRSLVSTRHAHKTKDRVTQTPLKTGGELGCSGQVSSDTRRVNLVTNAVLSHE
jgi:hypothetical protein